MAHNAKISTTEKLEVPGNRKKRRWGLVTETKKWAQRGQRGREATEKREVGGELLQVSRGGGWPIKKRLRREFHQNEGDRNQGKGRSIPKSKKREGQQWVGRPKWYVSKSITRRGR